MKGWRQDKNHLNFTPANDLHNTRVLMNNQKFIFSLKSNLIHQLCNYFIYFLSVISPDSNIKLFKKFLKPLISFEHKLLPWGLLKIFQIHNHYSTIPLNSKANKSFCRAAERVQFAYVLKRNLYDIDIAGNPGLHFMSRLGLDRGISMPEQQECFR